MSPQSWNQKLVLWKWWCNVYYAVFAWVRHHDTNFQKQGNQQFSGSFLMWQKRRCQKAEMKAQNQKGLLSKGEVKAKLKKWKPFDWCLQSSIVSVDKLYFWREVCQDLMVKKVKPTHLTQLFSRTGPSGVDQMGIKNGVIRTNHCISLFVLGFFGVLFVFFLASAMLHFHVTIKHGGWWCSSLHIFLFFSSPDDCWQCSPTSMMQICNQKSHGGTRCKWMIK